MKTFLLLFVLYQVPDSVKHKTIMKKQVDSNYRVYGIKVKKCK